MRILFLLLFSCTSRFNLDSAEIFEFENNWWELDCGLSECPLCFKLNQDHSVSTYDLDSNTYQSDGIWTYEGDNVYWLELNETMYKVFVNPKGDCYELSHSILSFQACRCPVELPV